MPRVIIVEDMSNDLGSMKRLLMDTTFRTSSGQYRLGADDVEEWWISNVEDFRLRIQEAGTTDAEMMIADLELFDSLQELPVAVELCREHLEQLGGGLDAQFWDATRDDRTSPWTGAVLVETFARAKPKMRSVAVATRHNNQATERWLNSLPVAASTLTGFLHAPDSRDTVVSFIQRLLADWSEALWNEETSGWFDRNKPNLNMSHPFPDLQAADKQEIARSAIEALLSRVFRPIEPPPNWFCTMDQFPALWKSLQAMIGFHACAGCAGGTTLPDYNLNLGNLVILLAIAMGRSPDVFAPSGLGNTLLSSVRWPSSTQQVLPRQAAGIARSNARWFVENFFGELIVSPPDEPGGQRKAALHQIQLTESCLQLTLGFDALHTRPGHVPFVKRALDPADGRFGRFSSELAMQTDIVGEPVAREQHLRVDVCPFSHTGEPDRTLLSLWAV